MRVRKRLPAITTVPLLIMGLSAGNAKGNEGAPEKVLFACIPAGQKASNIFLMNPDGSRKTNLTKTQQIELDPVWSPDRRHIAFAVFDPAQMSSDVYVMDSDGSKRARLTRLGAKIAAFGPSWSPDGKRIAFSLMHDADVAKTYVYVIDVDGKNSRRLGEGTGMLPVWSPNGKKILYTFFEKGERSPLDNPKLYVMDADGKHANALTKGKAQSGNYSPDGKRIAFLGIVGGETVIAVMNADGTEPKALLKAGSGEIGPRWSADGKRIFFNRVYLGASVIFVMDADGKTIKPLTGDTDQSVLGGNAFFMIATSRRTPIATPKSTETDTNQLSPP